ncbi:hypothetical protein [Muriicola sp.]|uniref:hypothetical protein n=1 Tax=Muriicola sp. TaxID=2020856 RepID=UPI003C755854
MNLVLSLQDFYTLVEHAATPPNDWSDVEAALWWDAKGNWERSHELVDNLGTPSACWIHAYLHRKEGDQWNAAYWYRKAQKPIPQISLETEFENLVATLLLS